MLDNKGFDLWADGYDLSVNISHDENTYPFAMEHNCFAEICPKMVTSAVKILEDMEE